MTSSLVSGGALKVSVVRSSVGGPQRSMADPAFGELVDKLPPDARRYAVY